jgi:hypothetical protein
MMSNFIEHLINRHLGKGEMLLPRARARFEPAAAELLPQDVEDDSTRITSTGSNVKPPNNIPAANTITMNEYNPAKQPVHEQQEPVIKFAKSYSSPGPIPQSIPDATVKPVVPITNVDMNRSEISKNKLKESPGTPNESPRQDEIENSLEHNIQNTPGGSLPQGEQGNSIKPGYASNPINIITVKTQENSDDQRPQQRPSTAHELSPSTGFPLDITGPEPNITESQAVFTAFQNTGSEAGGLLEAPAWLSHKQSELPKELFLMESKAEVEPVINVTIGRIEVRAVKQQEPPPPRRFVPPKPKLSLDDYLEQQNRSER